MHFQPVLSAVLGAALFSQDATAGCQIGNIVKKGISTPPKLCHTTPKGIMTMSMRVSSAGLPPSPDGGYNAFSKTYFYLFDHNCNIKGIYSMPTCGTPYLIQENFMPYTIKINRIFADVGSPAFGLAYGNGDYQARTKHGECFDMANHGLTAVKGCRVRFPHNGKARRSTEDLGFSEGENLEVVYDAENGDDIDNVPDWLLDDLAEE